MSKRARGLSQAQVDNRIRQNRGRGFGSDYKPWVYVHDVPSLGLCSRVKYKGRTAHYLSGLEKRAAMDFMWNPAVVDIREQFRIDVEDTIPIAERMGIKHPVDRATGTPFNCSSDFVLTVRGEDGVEREVVRSVKQVRELELTGARTKERRRDIEGTLAKLEIERRYWSDRGVDWALLTDRDLSASRCMNIEVMLKRGLDPDRPDGFWQDVVQRVCEALVSADGNTLDEVACGLANADAVVPDDFLSAVIWMCASRYLSFDIDRDLNLLRPVSDFTFVLPDVPAVRGAA